MQMGSLTQYYQLLPHYYHLLPPITTYYDLATTAIKYPFETNRNGCNSDDTRHLTKCLHQYM